jgi:predicted CXXCH cytochrome family protein
VAPISTRSTDVSPTHRLAARFAALALFPSLVAGSAAGAPAPPTTPKPSAAPAPAAAPAAAPPPKPARSASPLAPLAPLGPGETVAIAHAPFEAGDCSLCHARADAKNPGPIAGKVNELCFSCHEEFQTILARQHKHPPAADACTNCHNPHNSKTQRLLRAELPALCLGCHAAMKQTVETAKVKHRALAIDKSCANCHNPHGSATEKLLVKLPMDVCLGCHSKEGMRSADGKPLVNMKAWLDANKDWHGPVAANDCSACHKPHGSENFRLLVNEYPPSFYAAFDPKNYALCFGCHDEQVFLEPQTTTLTGFRRGSKNLHYVHVNKEERGRTCRACHEVHASKQDHHIRESVPYGPKGWMLKINYSKLPNGGQCTRTCHETRAYDRNAGLPAAPAGAKR